MGVLLTISTMSKKAKKQRRIMYITDEAQEGLNLDKGDILRMEKVNKNKFFLKRILPQNKNKEVDLQISKMGKRRIIYLRDHLIQDLLDMEGEGMFKAYIKKNEKNGDILMVRLVPAETPEKEYI
ncbi:MAG: hypothetical protein AMQ74_01999 [Candidatus Methanofastidiosum methylothiophilum]|uniref:Uncharacterized protein n=1 Tax=Candidatus Methanofastidiosum methylothiophilum TaxID=1705564 RepID=A0A150IHU6_9EURY|nr:MAG: hypothetical protein AMQ74_01999 [Candidatus Methanofastidiosum methylthiophilus]